MDRVQRAQLGAVGDVEDQCLHCAGIAEKDGVPVTGEGPGAGEQDSLGSGDQPPPQADETDPARRLSVNGGGEESYRFPDDPVGDGS
ncbi:MAG: hypothetical protein L0H84_13240 [Pseudonocardia sp.]|nr:hypothetical protein [Pseudonocardia sp.]